MLWSLKCKIVLIFMIDELIVLIVPNMDLVHNISRLDEFII